MKLRLLDHSQEPLSATNSGKDSLKKSPKYFLFFRTRLRTRNTNRAVRLVDRSKCITVSDHDYNKGADL